MSELTLVESNKSTTAADTARQTLIQLVKAGLPPTPENYTAKYNEIAGKKAPSVYSVLKSTLHDAGKKNPVCAKAESAIDTAINEQDWAGLELKFRKLFSQTTAQNTNDDVNWSTVIRSLLKQLETNHKGITLSRKKDGLNRVLINFAKDPIQLAEKIQALIRSWGNETISAGIETLANDTTSQAVTNPATHSSSQSGAQISSNNENVSFQLRDMMIRTLELTLIPLLTDLPQSHQEAQTMLADLRQDISSQTVTKCAHRLKNILFSIETQMEEKQSINTALISLLNLLATSMAEISNGDQWLKGQIDIVTDVLSKPVSTTLLQSAEDSLKELIHKQSNLKPALVDAQDLLKQMAATFITRLVEITETTDDYHHKIETHQKKLSSINGIDELNGVLKNVLDDTRSIGLTIQRTREEFTNSQAKVNEAEQKIQELTSVLEYINEVANEDYLTGTLNRRGMEEALDREFSRADRHHTALSIAMMDIDHFKKLNDKLGHKTGDEALVHFANVIKTVKRTTDVLARYGGEEFIIILPNTVQSDAIKVIERVQRKLTKQFFMHSDQHFVITFSAGVAQRREGELQEDIIPRADGALYEAKKSGRNRVLGAPIIDAEISSPEATSPSDNTEESLRH